MIRRMFKSPAARRNRKHTEECRQHLINYDEYKTELQLRQRTGFLDSDRQLCVCKKNEIDYEEFRTIFDFCEKYGHDEKLELKFECVVNKRQNLNEFLPDGENVIAKLIDSKISDELLETVIKSTLQIERACSKLPANPHGLIALVLKRPSIFHKLSRHIIEVYMAHGFDFTSIAAVMPEILLVIVKTQQVNYCSRFTHFLIATCGCDVNYVDHSVSPLPLLRLALKSKNWRIAEDLLTRYEYDLSLITCDDLLLAFENSFFYCALLIVMSTAKLMFGQISRTYFVDNQIVIRNSMQIRDLTKLLRFLHKIGFDVNAKQLEFKYDITPQDKSTKINNIDHAIKVEHRVKPLKVIAAEKYRRSIMTETEFEEIMNSNVDDEIKAAIRLAFIYTSL